MKKRYNRKTYFIDRQFQANFIFKFCLVVIVSSVLIGAGVFYFSRGSTTVAIENTKVMVKRTADFIMPVIISTLLLVSVFSAALMLFMTLFLSHKISGPLYRIKREVDTIKDGDLTPDFHIRGGDQLQHIASSLAGMSSVLREKQRESRERWGKIYSWLKEDNFSVREDRKGELSALARELDSSLEYFKI